MQGYSGTPLFRKLGIKPDSRICAMSEPGNYLGLLERLPEGAKVVPRIDERTDIIHAFVAEKKRLRDTLARVMNKMRTDAAVWISWPKKSSGVPTDITENAIREIALPLGLVDVKVCAIDDTWSGLKLVIRKENR